MDLLSYEKTALYEHRFWLQILGDHGRFIMNLLSPAETEAVQAAKKFIDTFDNLLIEARKTISGIQIDQFNVQVKNSAEEIRKFKLELIKRHLSGRITLHITPTLLNHMVNEVEEYLLILSDLIKKQNVAVHPVHHHLLWLSDAAGHASAITANIDEIEKNCIEKSMIYNKIFIELYHKAIDNAGYMRTGLKDFPELSRFNEQAEREIVSFMEFLTEVQDQRVKKRLPGTLMPLMTDHMYREECYYLMKLSQAAGTKKPDCDPSKPRIEG